MAAPSAGFAHWFLAILMVWTSGVSRAATLSVEPLYDLNGRGEKDVEHQTNDSLSVKAYDASHVNNRKALFLFDLSLFSGRNLLDQHIQTAGFTVHASDSQCEAYKFRLSW